MAILDEIKRITATRRDLRKFGLTFAIVLVLLSAYSVWKHVSAYNYLVPIAAALAVTGAWVAPNNKPLIADVPKNSRRVQF